MEQWDAAGFTEQDAQTKAKKARDEYKDALRQSSLRNLNLMRPDTRSAPSLHFSVARLSVAKREKG